MDYSTKMGVLWEKTKDGKKYMTGNIEINGEKHNIVIFSNNKRPDKMDPDWQVFPSQPREQKPADEPEDPPF